MFRFAPTFPQLTLKTLSVRFLADRLFRPFILVTIHALHFFLWSRFPLLKLSSQSLRGLHFLRKGQFGDLWVCFRDHQWLFLLFWYLFEEITVFACLSDKFFPGRGFLWLCPLYLRALLFAFLKSHFLFGANLTLIWLSLSPPSALFPSASNGPFPLSIGWSAHCGLVADSKVFTDCFAAHYWLLLVC